MDFQSFATGIRKKKPLPRVVVFAGTEALLRDRGLSLLKEAHPDLAAGMLRIPASETDWNRLSDELYTAPFFGGKKLVVLVDDGNFISSHREQVRAYTAEPSPTAILVALVPTLKLPKLEGATIVECRPLKPADLRRWLGAEAQRLGKTLDRAATDLLISRGGKDLFALAGHLEKLAVHAGTRSLLSVDDVRELVGNEEERQIYELSLATTSYDAAGALRILRALCSGGAPAAMLIWKLAWQYRKLAEARRLLDGGMKRFEVTSRLQITYYADDFLRRADAHPLEELVEKHGEILKADVALKTSGSGNEGPILESLVCRLAGRGKSGRSWVAGVAAAR